MHPCFCPGSKNNLSRLLIIDGKQEEAIDLMQGEVYVRADKIAHLLDKLTEALLDHVDRITKQNKQGADSAVLLAWIIAGCGTLLAIAFGVFPSPFLS